MPYRTRNVGYWRPEQLDDARAIRTMKLPPAVYNDNHPLTVLAVPIVILTTLALAANGLYIIWTSLPPLFYWISRTIFLLRVHGLKETLFALYDYFGNIILGPFKRYHRGVGDRYDFVVDGVGYAYDGPDSAADVDEDGRLLFALMVWVAVFWLGVGACLFRPVVVPAFRALRGKRGGVKKGLVNVVGAVLRALGWGFGFMMGAVETIGGVLREAFGVVMEWTILAVARWAYRTIMLALNLLVILQKAVMATANYAAETAGDVVHSVRNALGGGDANERVRDTLRDAVQRRRSPSDAGLRGRSASDVVHRGRRRTPSIVVDSVDEREPERQPSSERPYLGVPSTVPDTPMRQNAPSQESPREDPLPENPPPRSPARAAPQSAQEAAEMEITPVSPEGTHFITPDSSNQDPAVADIVLSPNEPDESSAKALESLAEAIETGTGAGNVASPSQDDFHNNPRESMLPQPLFSGARGEQ